MGLFDRPEVTILKESSDAREYLEKLEALQKEVQNDINDADLANRIDKEIAITKAGIAGEDAILFELKNSGMDLVVLHDLYIETADGRGAQIDFLVVTPYVNVLIECKNLFGNIEINSKGDFIRAYSWQGRWIKEGIYSPITQNERHLTVFKECRSEKKSTIGRLLMKNAFEKYNKTIVVLANPKTLVNDKYAPKEIRQKVIRGDQLIAALKGLKSDVKSNKKEMLAFGERYLALNRDDRKEYITRFQELAEQSRAGKKNRQELPEEACPDGTAEEGKTAAALENDSLTSVETVSTTETEMIEDALSVTMDATPQICPRCGKELVLRTAKRGERAGRQFYGCSGFPKCRYVKNL